MIAAHRKQQHLIVADRKQRDLGLPVREFPVTVPNSATFGMSCAYRRAAWRRPRISAGDRSQFTFVQIDHVLSLYARMGCASLGSG
ncbi:hypothetical protein LF63_0112685 [Oleiagrimonas soli]|uniref:Uncharacterized protein n=1 Tax=Oleiagrimonas soli TaxID=1543381 RepID=A0A099CT20_9GAMM|nr:hypothetical protein LF63_0112685 [Oleiagrimonas soli]